MNDDPRRARETSGGLFLIGLGLAIMLLNMVSSNNDGATALLGVAIVLAGGFIYPSSR
jgi:hypothetical protein